MQRDVFWARAEILCDFNTTIARGLREARIEYFKHKVQRLLVAIFIEWRSPITAEGRQGRRRPTRRTSRLFWLDHELELKLGWKEEWIPKRKLDLKDGKRRVADWHRLHLVASIQRQDELANEGARRLHQAHWWRIRWLIGNELSNPFVVENIQKEEDKRLQEDTEWQKHRTEWKTRTEGERPQGFVLSSSSSSSDSA